MTTIQEKTFTKKQYDKNYDHGYKFGYESGRLSVFEKQLNIKYTVWSVCYLNGKSWSIGDKELDYALDHNVNKPLKIIYNYRWFDENYKSQNQDLTGSAKNNTIAEVWKGIEKLYIKYGLEGTDHHFIEIIEIKDNVLRFYTGS
tara:strand:+ start:177 stop:608 length:432 start_codon:yes stop_codon:yes gene_type:complete